MAKIYRLINNNNVFSTIYISDDTKTWFKVYFDALKSGKMPQADFDKMFVLADLQKKKLIDMFILKIRELITKTPIDSRSKYLQNLKDNGVKDFTKITLANINEKIINEVIFEMNWDIARYSRNSIFAKMDNHFWEMKTITEFFGYAQTKEKRLYHLMVNSKKNIKIFNQYANFNKIPEKYFLDLKTEVFNNIGFSFANNWIEKNSKIDILNNQKIELSLKTFLKLSKLKFSNILGEITHNDNTGVWYENIPANDIVVRGNKVEYSANGKVFVYQNKKWSYTNNGGFKNNIDGKVIRYWFNSPAIKVFKTEIIQKVNQTKDEQMNEIITWLNGHYSTLGHILDKVVDVIFNLNDTSVVPLKGWNGLYDIQNYVHNVPQLTLRNRENSKLVYIFKDSNNKWRISTKALNDTNAGFMEHMLTNAYKCESRAL